MKFTDEDLKRLKEHASLPTRDMIMISHNQALALIARLEAAELCAGFYAIQNPETDTVLNWRKAAGK